ncbi:MAG: hypothetical protein ACRD3T_22375 [Terriglobia bacterium]
MPEELIDNLNLPGDSAESASASGPDREQDTGGADINLNLPGESAESASASGPDREQDTGGADIAFHGGDPKAGGSAPNATPTSKAMDVPPVRDVPPSPPESQPRLQARTAKQIAASRRNARKSTGPRTLAGKARVARNAIQQGLYVRENGGYAQCLAGSMEEMGEDPKQFSRIQEGLMSALRPVGAAQTMLVEDIASLRWERRRLERAQAALVSRRMQQLELVRQRHSLQVSQQITADIPVSFLRLGVLWTRDSATKFQKMLEWLEGLKERLEVGEFSGAEALIGWIFGENLTLRGAMIKGLFQELAEAGPGIMRPSERPAGWFTLRRELLAEISNVTQQYQLYLRENVELTPTMREECLAPTVDQRWLMRQMSLVDRQIERKTRLLLDMQQASSKRDEAPECEASAPGAERPDEASGPRKLIEKRIV